METLDKLEKAMMSIIPYIVFIDKNLLFYVPVIILGFNLFKIITQKNIDYFGSEYEYKIMQHETHRILQVDNLYYKYMTFLLEKNDLMKFIKKFECETYKINFSEKKYNTGYNYIDYNIEPVTVPLSSEKIKFDFQDVSVYIQSISIKNYNSNDNNNNNNPTTKLYYSITSKNLKNIKLFLQYLDDIRIEYHESQIKEDSYKFLTFHKIDKWIKHNINVNKTIENIFLPENKKNTIINNVENFFNEKDSYDKFGMARKISFLLYGKPGNGKSSIVYAIAKTYNKKIFKLNLNLRKDDFVKQIDSIDDNAIILIDDVDTINLSHNRSKEKNDNDSAIVSKDNDNINLGDILEILDGYCYFNECVVFMTTNHIEKLDPALIRPGRMDHKIEFDNAIPEQIIQIIKYFFNKDITKKQLSQIEISISVSELINTIIIPNLNNYAYVINYLTSQ